MVLYLVGGAFGFAVVCCFACLLLLADASVFALLLFVLFFLLLFCMYAVLCAVLCAGVLLFLLLLLSVLFFFVLFVCVLCYVLCCVLGCGVIKRRDYYYLTFCIADGMFLSLFDFCFLKKQH